MIFKAIATILEETIKAMGYLVIGIVQVVFILIRSIFYNFHSIVSYISGGFKKITHKIKKPKIKKEKKIKKVKKEKKKKRGRPKKKISFIKKLVLNISLFFKSLRRYFNTKLTKIKRLKIKLPKITLPRIKIKLPVRLIFFTLGVLFALLFITIPYEAYVWFRELPKAELLVVEGYKKPTRILDKEGRLLYEIYVDRKYDPVKLSQVPQHVIDATIAVEDSEFYNHVGVRPVRILKAAQKTLLEGEKQGASTITQQLIKNVLLTPERTISRKIKEIVLAFFVEAKYTKDQILELYLNNISYGGVAWGIQSASQKYYGKNVWELSLAEASMLAGLPSAPSTFSPLTDLGLAKQRQLHVLNRMYELGYITKTELVKAFDEELIFAEQGDFIRAPHFVHLIRKELEGRYGKRFVEYGGLTVITTLDLELQEEVEKIVKEEVEKNEHLNLTNGAVVVLDAKRSGILGYVGSVDYFKEGWGAFDVASAYRQPGSSIKPVTYALALEKGYTPASIIEDAKITYTIAGSKPYTPVNYDSRYHGKVTLRSALANSYNIPAVKLAYSVGPDNIIEQGNKMGLKNWIVDGSYGLSITLGGKEVRLLDHTNVFGTFARGGVYKEVSPFISIKDSKGYELYRDNRQEEQVLSKEISYLIWNILSDNGARTPAFGTNHQLTIPNYNVAAKTGTTDSKRDNWTMGFTPSYVVGVWVGNNDNTPMNQYLASGLTGAAPIWNRVMTKVLEDEPNELFAMPENVFTKYDKECNRSEVFIKGSNVPKTLCPPKEDKDKDKDDKDKDTKKD